MLLARASIRTRIRGALGQELLRRGTKEFAVPATGERALQEHGQAIRREFDPQ